MKRFDGTLAPKVSGELKKEPKPGSSKALAKVDERDFDIFGFGSANVSPGEFPRGKSDRIEMSFPPQELINGEWVGMVDESLLTPLERFVRRNPPLLLEDSEWQDASSVPIVNTGSGLKNRSERFDVKFEIGMKDPFPKRSAHNLIVTDRSTNKVIIRHPGTFAALSSHDEKHIIQPTFSANDKLLFFQSPEIWAVFDLTNPPKDDTVSSVYGSGFPSKFSPDGNYYISFNFNMLISRGVYWVSGIAHTNLGLVQMFHIAEPGPYACSRGWKEAPTIEVSDDWNRLVINCPGDGVPPFKKEFNPMAMAKRFWKK